MFIIGVVLFALVVCGLVALLLLYMGSSHPRL
jgi:hypothetical protein